MLGCDTIIDVRFAQGQRPLIEGRATVSDGTGDAALNAEHVELTGELLTGWVALAKLPRLGDYLRATAGTVQFELKPARRADQKSALDLRLEGELTLTCQRCLGALQWSLTAQRQIVFVPAESLPDVEDEEEFADFIPMESHFVLRELIEDEVLLALPMIALHPEGGCEAQSYQDAAATSGSPFSVLKNLGKH